MEESIDVTIPETGSGLAPQEAREAGTEAGHYERIDLEATAGFEPANEGFADPCLTTWPRRP